MRNNINRKIESKAITAKELNSLGVLNMENGSNRLIFLSNLLLQTCSLTCTSLSTEVGNSFECLVVHVFLQTSERAKQTDGTYEALSFPHSLRCCYARLPATLPFGDVNNSSWETIRKEQHARYTCICIYVCIFKRTTQFE